MEKQGVVFWKADPFRKQKLPEIYHLEKNQEIF